MESANENLQDKGKDIENELFLCQKELDSTKNDYYETLNELDAAKNDLTATENDLEQLQQQLDKEEKANSKMELQNIQMSTKLNRQDEELLKVKMLHEDGRMGLLVVLI